MLTVGVAAVPDELWILREIWIMALNVSDRDRIHYTIPLPPEA